jgi:pimeloyl-ACP methyl ester carboxylesterase
MRTHLIHRPARASFHYSVDLEFSPIGFDPERFSCGCHGLLPGPAELSAISVEKFGKQKSAEVNGKRVACIEEGAGAAIVFQHGNPTSSYLWRNVMPHCAGLGRLIACDLIGMGGSEKLSNGPDRYGYQEQRDFLFRLWDYWTSETT